MGHNAFEGSYRKPNLKLHTVIFLTIVGVSVFLSTQVEKTKNNVDVKALKTPVPIDSVFVNETSQQNNPTVAKSSVTQPVTKEQEAEYHFDNGSNLAAIDQMLAKHDESSASEVANVAVNDLEPSMASRDTASQQENTKEKDVAIMVTDDEVQESAVLASSTDIETPVSDTDTKITTDKPRKVGKLDAVYELQQDRFLETLAKTATTNNEETPEVKRMKQAMKTDKPLKRTSTVSQELTSKDENTSVIKVVVNQSPEKGKKPDSQVESVASKSRKNVVKKDRLTTSSNNLQTAKLKNEELLLTRSELNNVLSQFTRSYNRGDIQRLMALFDDNAVTNDQHSKNGIKAEYSELFSNTSVRNIKIRNIQWDLGKGKARGDARFTVTVKPSGSNEIAQIEGKLEILAIKESRGVFIKSLLHEVSTR